MIERRSKSELLIRCNDQTIASFDKLLKRIVLLLALKSRLAIMIHFARKSAVEQNERLYDKEVIEQSLN